MKTLNTQKKKHLAFAQRLLDNHYLGKGKYILVHYDEKWFWSKMLRSQAKECAEFGVEQQNIRTRHKITP